MPSDETESQNTKTVGLKNPVYFNICEDIEKIKQFYSGMLGLKEVGYCENTSIEYIKDGKTMIFYQNDKTSSIGSKSLKSFLKPFNWSIKADSNLFLKVFKLINKSPLANEGLLTLDLFDPMGNSITVYLESEKFLKKTVS